MPADALVHSGSLAALATDQVRDFPNLCADHLSLVEFPRVPAYGGVGDHPRSVVLAAVNRRVEGHLSSGYVGAPLVDHDQKVWRPESE